MDPLGDKLAHAVAQIQAGQAARALAQLQRLIPGHPAHAQLASTIAYALLTLGKHAEATYYAQRAADLAPNDARMLANLALLVSMKDTAGRERARPIFERALALDPSNADARTGLANVLMERGEFAALETLCAGAAQLPAHAPLVPLHAGALMGLGRLREAMQVLAAGSRSFPDDLRIRGGLATTSQYVAEAAPAEVARLHKDYGAILERATPTLESVWAAHAPKADDAERVLRVGVLSPDLRTHSVAYFIEAYFANHDRARVELFAYCTSSPEDGVSLRLRGLAAQWRSCAGMKPPEVARAIASDKIDVLVDLAGHTQGHNLPVLAMRPAPVQVTYLGYPDTTGLSRVDYRIVDARTDPVGVAAFPTRDGAQPTFDERCSETLWRLGECFLCYHPPADSPEVAVRASPEAARGVVFGSFNAARKVSNECAALWSRVLRGVPASRLVLKAAEFQDPRATDRLRAVFTAEGVDDRVEFLPPTKETREHLSAYAGVDIALDTWPYHGTTTTCEALWMGVPVVTLAGDRHASRVGVSLLHAAGLAELVATDADAFVRTASDLARDAERLAHLRRTLRGRVAASALCDQRAFAARLDGAFRGMWRRACGGE